MVSYKALNTIPELVLRSHGERKKNGGSYKWSER